MDTERIFSDIRREGVIRHHRESTITRYIADWKYVCDYFKDIDHPKNISAEKFKDFFQFIGTSISQTTAAGCFYAVKYYYANVEGHPHKFDGIKIKRPHAKIPEVLDDQEIMKVINECENIYDKSVIATFYGTGARLSELITLEKSDIHRDGEKSFIHIKDGKGAKPRIVPLRPEVINIIDKHIESLPLYKRFSRFLFPGEKKDHYLSRRTAERIVKRNFIEKNVYPHLLRHSLGTWLFEQGVPLLAISQMFGHSTTRPTEIYVRVRPTYLLNTPNPFDSKKVA